MNLEIFFHNIHSCPLHISDCSQLICASRLEQIQHKQPADQLRSLSGDLLVLYALRQRGYPASLPLQYDRTKYGKPYLSNCPQFHFNVSHSGDWVVCAAASQDIGIDIQQERPVKTTLLHHTLSKQELLYVNKLPAGQRQAAFFDLWCMKEAYCKATGFGLIIPMKSIDLSRFRGIVSNSDSRVRLLPAPEQSYHVGLCSHTFLPDEIPIHIITQMV